MPSVCRICFAGNTSLNSVKNNQLISFYEKLTNAKFNSEDARPRALCCVCYQKLLKCHTFSQMAVRSENIFSNLYDRGLEVTHEYITEVNLNMKQPLSVATMSFVSVDPNEMYAGSEVTIKDEPLPRTDIKEDMNIELDTLEEIGCFPEHSTRSRLTFEEDDSDQEKDAEELLYETHSEPTIPDDSKTPYSCISRDEILYIKSKLISHSHSQVEGKQYSSTKKHTETTEMIKDKAIHIQRKKWACNVCDKQFKYKGYLVNHMRTHPGEKPFACNVCDNKFIQKGNLVRHMRTHTGEKPFACNVCGKKFTQKSNLVRHNMRTHIGEKPFPCNVCDKQFTLKGNLVRHMRTHTGEKPFACNVCDKQFNLKHHLVVHMSTHPGEKPFGCNVCDKQFTLKGNLVVHMRTHTGEKPFACNVCDKQFSRKGHLVSHLRTHKLEKLK